MLKKQVEKNTADRILEYVNSVPIVNSERKPSFASITRESDTKRYYPQNELAAAVIGFNNSDGDGVYGIEAYYNDYLSGIDGKTITAKDASGNEMPYRYSKTYDAQDGDDVYLTIDMTLQTYVENALTEMVETFSVENRGCGIMLNAKTGAVLAMAVYPSYNLNDPWELNWQSAAFVMLRLGVRFSPLALKPPLRAAFFVSSVLKRTVCFSIPRFLSSLRITFAKGQPLPAVSEISPIRSFSGSRRFPVPRHIRSFIPRFLHSSAIWSFAVTVSIASII